VSLSAIPRALRNQIFSRDLGHCRYCNLNQLGQSSIFHINHVIPRSKGGLTVEANLVLQCPSCSLHKADKLTSIDPVGGDEIVLYHPLINRWQSHFSLSSDGRCHGVDAIGRATIEALRMNDELPRLARAIQIQLGPLIITS
jgi:hypothetical protein